MKNEKLTQRIESLVNQEILLCQSSLVEAMLQNDMASYDDIENIYKDNSEEIEEQQNKIEALEDKENKEIEESESMLENEEISEFTNERNLEIIEEKYTELKAEVEDQIQELENEQEEPAEIFEWWAVTTWFADKLRNYNECILDNDYGTWWGRTTTGQNISMDYIMEKIASDLISK